MKEEHRLTFPFKQIKQQLLQENQFHLAIRLKIQQTLVLVLIKTALGLIQLASVERLEQCLIHFHSRVFIVLSQLAVTHMVQHAVMVFGLK